MFEIGKKLLKELTKNFKEIVELLPHNGKTVDRYPTSKGWYLSPFPMEKGIPYCADNLVTTARAPFLTDSLFLKAKAKAEGRWESKEIRDISWRLDMMLSCISHALRAQESNNDNIFVECGTGRGYMAAGIFDYFNWDNNKPPFYLIDSFIPNMPDETGDQLSSNDKSFVYSDGDSEVREYFSQYENVKIITGLIPEILSLLPDKKIGFLHIDLNHAIAEKSALEYLKPKLAKGAIVLFDDYGGIGGEQQAQMHEEFSNNMNYRLWTLPTGQGLYFHL